MNWDQYFITLAYFVAMKSKDPRTRIGAVIVGPDHEIRSTGYNGLPRGLLESEERNCNPIKYLYYEHGERNSVYNAARMGLSVSGCSIYTQGTPCPDCARAIIQSGISEVVTHAEWDASGGREKWVELARTSATMLREAGVILRQYDGALESTIIVYRDGERIPLGLRRNEKE